MYCIFSTYSYIYRIRLLLYKKRAYKVFEEVKVDKQIYDCFIFNTADDYISKIMVTNINGVKKELGKIKKID